MKTIYDLKLHESLMLDRGLSIMRVPGGWIYDNWDAQHDIPKTGVFVPFENEFQE